jgi:hypothetical protein
MEKILRDYLVEAEGVAEIVGTRVATKTPDTLKEPWIRLSIIDDPPAGRSSVDHFIEFYVQAECYAGKDGTQSKASLLARTVRALIAEMGRHDHEGAVVTGTKIRSSRSLRDDSLQPAMDRYVVTASIWAHSVEEVGS